MMMTPMSLSQITRSPLMEADSQKIMEEIKSAIHLITLCTTPTILTSIAVTITGAGKSMILILVLL